MNEKPNNDDTVFFLNKLLPSRYILSVLGCIGMGIVYGLKVNLSTAIIAMVRSSGGVLAVADIEREQAVMGEQQCVFEGRETNRTTVVHQDTGEFEWTSSVRGIILSSYFIGYLVSLIPAGRIAETYSAKMVMLYAILVNIVATLLTPLAAKIHFSLLIAMRIIEGLGGGLTFPCMHVILSKWAPKSERSIHSSIVYSGTSLGTVLTILSTGYLIEHRGWEASFYWPAIVCLPWCPLWYWFVENSPQQQRYITAEERRFICQSLGHRPHQPHTNRPLPLPWREIFKSRPFRALLFTHLLNNWGWYLILLELPTYVKQILQYKIQENAVLTAIPYLTLWLFSLVLSNVLDYLRGRNRISTTTVRKIATFFCSIVPAVCLAGLCFVGCSRAWAITLITIAVTASGGMFSGYLSNHIDLASNFAGSLISITNTIATIPGILVPFVVEHLTDKNPTIESWRIIFLITITTFSLEFVIFAAFGSGDEQPWNRASDAPVAAKNDDFNLVPDGVSIAQK